MVTVPTLSAGDYPPAGRRFLTAYGRLYGAWQPDAIYGYEAMSLILDAVSRATGDGTRPAVRSRVTRALFATRDRRSVLGTYGITRLGDTTLRRGGSIAWRTAGSRSGSRCPAERGPAVKFGFG